MQGNKVVMARIYVMESSGLLKKIVDYLQHDIKTRGISVFRAISGYGETGAHTAAFTDLSLNLPLAIEFFDATDKMMVALTHIATWVKPEHIVWWEAEVNA